MGMLAFLAWSIPISNLADTFTRGENKMKNAVLILAMLFLFAGCSKGVAPSESSTPAEISKPYPTSQLESNPPEEAVIPTSSPVSPEAVPSPVPEAAEEAFQASEDSDSPQEVYEASEAVQIEAVDGGIQVVFEQLPQTVEELESLLSLYPQSDARYTGAFFIASLVRYLDSPDDGHAMINLLRGPRPMNDMDKSFLKDRLREKAYLPGAYFEGATPENDYTPDTPLTLMIYDDPMEAEEGYCYIQVATTGADSRRRITLREKDGQYYLWEYSNVLTGIRLPASLDPWL